MTWKEFLKQMEDSLTRTNGAEIPLDNSNQT